MKQLKNISATVLLLCFLAMQACQNKNDKWTLKGSSELAGSMVYLFKVENEMQPTLLDSAEILNGTFTFLGSNTSPDLECYLVAPGKKTENGTDVLLANGDLQTMVMRKPFESEFSGTPQSENLNTYYSLRQRELDQNTELSQDMSNLRLDPETKNQKMMLYREKMQELENEKIDFLRSIKHPQLNSHLVLKEVLRSGVVEKEVFGKYVEALTAEGALTDNGIKVHRIYEVFDAYALSLEMSFLDTATIHERYGRLSEECRNSEYARKVQEHLSNLGIEAGIPAEL